MTNCGPCLRKCLASPCALQCDRNHRAGYIIYTVIAHLGYKLLITGGHLTAPGITYIFYLQYSNILNTLSLSLFWSTLNIIVTSIDIPSHIFNFVCIKHLILQSLIMNFTQRQLQMHVPVLNHVEKKLFGFTSI